MKGVYIHLTKEQCQNLEILANYLLSVDPETFSMHTFMSEGAHGCGTTHCALGYLPNALGEKIEEIEWFNDGPVWSNSSWHGYSLEKLGMNCNIHANAWQFLFGSLWANVDNSPIGAAIRINWLLHHGVPTQFKTIERAGSEVDRQNKAEQFMNVLNNGSLRVEPLLKDETK